MENNFKCTKCDHTDFIPRYKTFFENGLVYRLPNGNPIRCTECGADMESIPKNNGFGQVGKYSSMSMIDKKKAIKKRADEHTKKNMDEIRSKQ